MSRKIDETGKVYSELTVLGPAESKSGARWHVRCSCGNERIVPGVKLRNGGIKSCGHGLNVTHGLRQTRLYTTWCNIKARCSNPKKADYENYGGRNITVCSEWLESFQAFYDWSIDNGYDDALSIDRKDVNGNYEPDNCRWVSMKVQNRNRRNNTTAVIGGRTYCLAELAELTGIQHSTLSWRYHRGVRGDELVRPVK